MALAAVYAQCVLGTKAGWSRVLGMRSLLSFRTERPRESHSYDVIAVLVCASTWHHPHDLRWQCFIIDSGFILVLLVAARRHIDVSFAYLVS